MTRVTIYKNAEGGYRGISVSGHSGYAAAGLISCEISGETASVLSSETQILLKAYEMGILELSRRYNEVGLVIKQDEISV